VGVVLFSFLASWLFGVAAARVARGLQQVTARGLILNNPHRTRWGFFFFGFWHYLGAHRARCSAAPEAAIEVFNVTTAED
jgi:hypothetical protein